MTFYIGPLTSRTTGADIEQFFAPMTVSVDIKTDPTTGRSRRFALVEADAQAISHSGGSLNGQVVTVKEME